MCATNPKFLSSAPEMRSPINDLLQPVYSQRPAARAHSTRRLRSDRAFVRVAFGGDASEVNSIFMFFSWMHTAALPLIGDEPFLEIKQPQHCPGDDRLIQAHCRR